MAPRTDLLHHGSVHSQQQNQGAGANESEIQSGVTQLGFCFVEGTKTRHTESVNATAEGVLGIHATAEASFMEDEIAGILKAYCFRPSQLVRLLNDTDLGQVLSERQLYRHRQRARIHADSKRVNLLAYCAWLHTERHRGRSVRSRRRRVIDRDVLTLGELRKILNAQGYRCALSGELLTTENVALDHIIPVSEGGGFAATNCQLVTSAVNRAKNTMSQSDFVEMCHKVVAYQGTKAR